MIPLIRTLPRSVKTRRRTFIASTLALVCVVVIVHDVYLIYYISRFNEALRQGAIAEAAASPLLSGRLAKAYELQQKGQFPEAIRAYSLIEQTDDKRLQTTIKFNTANLYLQWAMTVDGEDLTVPLIELAKETYRELLRMESGDWEAKYNLERALALLPEVEEEEVEDETMPERSPRAAASIEIHRELP